jgi:hypothetical protein
LPSGLAIRHSEGPLAGRQQFFPDGVSKITFGRPDQVTDVSYPRDYTKIGRFHFSLNQKGSGNYYVELTPNHYVEIDGEPAKSASPVRSGSVFRLGGPTGPSFEVLVQQPEKEGAETEENYAPRTERWLIKQLQRAAAVLLAVVLAGGGYLYWRNWQQSVAVDELAARLVTADAKISKLAENDIPQAAQDALRQAVYLVAKLDGARPQGLATAWAFAPDKLATNAHVVKEMIDKRGMVERDFVLIAPDGTEVKLTGARAEVHPAYFSFADYKNALGQVSGDKFRALDIIKEYDVGIIHLSEPLPGKPAVLELASKEHIQALKPGAAVASIGFPIEGMTATMVVTKAPASLRFGNIGALTDVFMSRAAADKSFLIQHSVPVAGGVSGSPLIDASGKVIAIVSGGTTSAALREVDEALKRESSGDDTKDKHKKTSDERHKETESFRIPSAAMINFAHRIDLLEDMISGEAEENVAQEQAYWDAAAKSFDRHFDGVVQQLLAAAKEQFGVDGETRTEIATGTLTPRRPGSWSLAVTTQDYVLEPHHVYAFIADARSGVRLALNVRKKGSAELLRDARDPQKTSVPELSPVVWVTVDETTQVDIDVLSTTDRPAHYALYVYDWALDTGAPAAEATSAAKD